MKIVFLSNNINVVKMAGSLQANESSSSQSKIIWKESIYNLL